MRPILFPSLRRVVGAAIAAVLTLGGSACRPSAGPIDGPVVSREITMDDGQRVVVRLFGNGPDTVLVVPGGFSFGAEYLVQTLGPLGRGRTLVVVDPRGRGLSPDVQDSTTLTPGRDATDLLAMMDSLRLGPIGVVADHYGAMVVALAAHRSPTRFTRFVLTAPVFPAIVFSAGLGLGVGDTTWLRPYYKATERMAHVETPVSFCQAHWPFYLGPMTPMDSTILRRLAPTICAGPESRLRTAWGAKNKLLGRLADMDLRDTLAQLRVPTLVLSGDRNPAIRDIGVLWAGTIPDAQMKTIPLVWPQFMWITAPEPTFVAMDRFLRGEPVEGLDVRTPVAPTPDRDTTSVSRDTAKARD